MSLQKNIIIAVIVFLGLAIMLRTGGLLMLHSQMLDRLKIRMAAVEQERCKKAKSVTNKELSPVPEEEAEEEEEVLEDQLEE